MHTVGTVEQDGPHDASAGSGNLEFLPDRKIKSHLGLVQGSSVRSKHVGRDIGASIKSIFGGELKGYTELLHDSREEATQRLLEQARSLGANAVINVRYSTSSMAALSRDVIARASFGVSSS